MTNAVFFSKHWVLLVFFKLYFLSFFVDNLDDASVMVGGPNGASLSVHYNVTFPINEDFTPIPPASNLEEFWELKIGKMGYHAVYLRAATVKRVRGFILAYFCFLWCIYPSYLL